MAFKIVMSTGRAGKPNNKMRQEGGKESTQAGRRLTMVESRIPFLSLPTHHRPKVKKWCQAARLGSASFVGSDDTGLYLRTCMQAYISAVGARLLRRSETVTSLCHACDLLL